MRDMDTKTRIRVTSIALFLAVFIVWAIFYFVISGYIEDSTERQMTQAADHIIERLGGEFSQAERLLGSFVSNIDIQTLAAEQNPDTFFMLAGRFGNLPGTGTYNPDFIKDIIIYDTKYNYYRLTGHLGNVACSRLADILSASSLPGHLAVTLEQRNYIGYAGAVPTDGGKSSGVIAMLIEEEKILEIMRAYDHSGALLVVIEADGETVAANTDRIELFDRAYSNRSFVRSRLGITPYEITVVADPGQINASVVYFTVVAVVTALIIAVIIILYSDTMNRRFFRPMVKVIGSIENLNAENIAETLPHVQSREFDGLIDKINQMLRNLERKNSEIRAAEFRAVNAEIEGQKALMFSLKKQISAHFTINTLNTIRLLVEQEDLEKAESTAAGLISLFRYAYDKDELINIWDELDILRKYVFIMNTRFDGKLEAKFDFDDHLMAYSIPRMLLQPVIENAITHGFREMDCGCVISVKAELRGGTVFFSVRDNGRGMSADELSALNDKLSIDTTTAHGYENIALLNIKNRLYHYYGNAGHFTIRNIDSGGVEVSILVPGAVRTEGDML